MSHPKTRHRQLHWSAGGGATHKRAPSAVTSYRPVVRLSAVRRLTLFGKVFLLHHVQHLVRDGNVFYTVAPNVHLNHLDELVGVLKKKKGKNMLAKSIIAKTVRFWRVYIESSPPPKIYTRPPTPPVVLTYIYIYIYLRVFAPRQGEGGGEGPFSQKEQPFGKYWASAMLQIVVSTHTVSHKTKHTRSTRSRSKMRERLLSIDIS